MKKTTKKTAPKTVGKINTDVRVLLREFAWRIDWEAVKKHFNGQCVYCGEKKDLHKDHAIPMNEKYLGLCRQGNIVPACRQCNSDKGSKDYINFCRYHSKDGKIAKRGRDAEHDITEYMKSEGYKRLGKNEAERDKIRKIISKTREEMSRIRSETIAKIAKLVAKKPAKKAAK